MKKIVSFLSSIGKDKFMHASVGAALAFVSVLIAGLIFNEQTSVAISFWLCSIAFLYKEATDEKFCWKDIVANYSLSTIVWVAYLI